MPKLYGLLAHGLSSARNNGRTMTIAEYSPDDKRLNSTLHLFLLYIVVGCVHYLRKHGDR